MENNFIYVSYADCSNQSLRNNDIRLERFDSLEIATYYIEGELVEWLKSKDPLLITNDERLYLKFRHAYSFEEFKKFCKELPEGESILNAFEQLCQGAGNSAYKSYSTERWTDEDTGQTYSLDYDNGWKVEKIATTNSIIKGYLKKE